MSLSKELLHISTSTRIISDHLNFLHELEEKEIRYGPCELPRHRLRDRQNPFDLRPVEFRRTFGMTREAFSQLLSMIEPQLRRERDRRNGNILPIYRLCIFLQYLRTNSFHKSVASQQFIQVTQPLVTRTVNETSRIIASLTSRYVQFPSIEEGNDISRQIYEDTKFPGVIGDHS